MSEPSGSLPGTRSCPKCDKVIKAERYYEHVMREHGDYVKDMADDVTGLTLEEIFYILSTILFLLAFFFFVLGFLFL